MHIKCKGIEEVGIYVNFTKITLQKPVSYSFFGYFFSVILLL